MNSGLSQRILFNCYTTPTENTPVVTDIPAHEYYSFGYSNYWFSCSMAAVTTAEQRLVYFLFLFVIFERSCSQWQNSEKFYSTTVKFSVSQGLIYRPNFSTQIGIKKKISRDSAACQPRPQAQPLPLRGYCVENTVGNARSGLAENAEKSV